MAEQAKPPPPVGLYIAHLPVPEPFQYDVIYKPKECATVKQKTHYLAQLSRYRENLRFALQTSTSLDHQIKAAETFLALLVDVMTQRKSNTMLKWKAMNIQWRPSLHHDNLQFVQTEDPDFDLSMSYLTLGYLLMNLAAQEVANNPNKQDGAKQASHHLRRAGGVFQQLLENVTEKWLNLPQGRPVECLKPVVTALKELCVVQSQQLALWVGQTAKTISATVSTALQHHVVARYEAINSMLDELSPADRSSLNLDFKQFINIQMLLARVRLAHISANVAHDAEKHGLAIAFIEKAKPNVDLLVAAPRRQERGLGAVFVEVDAEIAVFNKNCRTYKTENETIYFDPVPAPNTVKFSPAKALFQHIPYELPAISLERVDLAAP